MSLYKGNVVIKDLYKGSTKISKLYHGSTLVYSSSSYVVDQVIFEKATAGTYSLDLLENGKYEVICIAGGGGSTHARYYGGSSAILTYNYGGASGSMFKGIIILNKGTYSLVVGAKGIGSTSGSISNKIGGVSSIGNIVSCPSQKSSGHNSISGAQTNNGSPTVTATIISTTVNSAGNNGTVSYSSGNGTGGKSLFDNTSTGYGAGGSASGPYTGGTYTDGIDGYIKIVYKGT